MRKILLTGVQGQVGWELRRTLGPLGRVIAVDRAAMDLSDPDSIRRCVREYAPDLIVNPAAYTAVDKAESEPDLALSVNGLAPGVLAEEAKRLKALLIHYSTDYVFDGNKIGAYTEDDAKNPQNTYGRTKLAGEEAIRSVGAEALILRTSWVYGARGKNFLLTMARLIRERDSLNIVDDQRGAPTWSRMIAEASALMAAIMLRDPGAARNLAGTYHLSAAGACSWYDFATAIRSRLPDAEAKARLSPIASADYPTPAQRPSNSVMANDKLKAQFHLCLPAWEDSLSLCMAAMRTD